MNIELVDFYPGTNPKDKKYLGTLHVYIEDFDLDIRGIDVKRGSQGNKLFYNLPKRKAFDPDVQKLITFDVISFTDPRKKKQLISYLIENATDLVFSKLQALAAHKRDKS